MPKPRKRAQTPQEVTEMRWLHACADMHLFSPKWTGNMPILKVDPVLAGYLFSLQGKERQSLHDALHAVLDIRVRIWSENLHRYTNRVSRTASKSFDVEGTSLRVRLTSGIDTVIDIVGNGGYLSDDEIIFDKAIPSTVLDGCLGRTTADILGDPKGRFDGTRTIKSAFMRFDRQSVLGLDYQAKREINYRELIGDPNKRFPDRPPASPDDDLFADCA